MISRTNPVIRTERKTVDLYYDPDFLPGAGRLGKLRSAAIMRMEAKGWELIKEENGIGLFERKIRLKVW